MADEEKVESAEEAVPTEPVAEAPVEETKEEPVAEEVTTVAVVTKHDDLRAGMTVRIHEKIEDVTPKGEKRSRIQIFEGLILGIRGAGISKTMTVRKVADAGVGVEKIYPLNLPAIDKVEVVKTAKVRRAKLSFITDKRSKFRRKLKEVWNK